MDKSIIVGIVIFLTVLVVFSGCINLELTEEEEPKVLLEDGNIYEYLDVLEGVTFDFPEEIDTSNGIKVTVSLYRPDESTGGQLVVDYAHFDEPLFFDFPDVSLYYPGTWAVYYSIDDLVSGAELLTGYGTFYVKEADENLALFEITAWECPKNTTFLGSFSVNFTVKNVGRESGDVELTLLNTKLDDSLVIYTAGFEWWNESIRLDDGEEYSEHVYIPLPQNDLTVTLRYNDLEMSQDVDIIGSAPALETVYIPVEYVWILGIVVVLLLLYIFLKRR